MMRRRTVVRATDPRILIAAALASALPARLAFAQEHRVFELSVREQRIEVSDQVIRVEEGDRVELHIAADEDGELHLHGYDVTIELHAGQTSVATVDADVAGRFPVTSHGFASSADAEHGHSHETLFYLEVYPR